MHNGEEWVSLQNVHQEEELLVILIVCGHEKLYLKIMLTVYNAFIELYANANSHVSQTLAKTYLLMPDNIR